MNDVAKTGVCAGAAAALTLLALSVGPRAKVLDEFDDEGKLFFESFKDPAAVAELEVIEYREAAGAPFPFAVKRDDKGRWTIPSHYNYPADAKDRMAKAATLMIGLKKDAVIGDKRGLHGEYGLLDPLDPSGETKGRGTRVKMKDSAGNVLADLIIGKEVEGKPGVHYVRVPEKKRVYRTKIAGEVSTKFADWIETDLLKASSWEISKVTFDNYSVDEQAGVIKKGDVYVVSKDDAGKWTFAGLDATKEEPNEEKLREIGDTLGQFKIVGVRPKPEGLTARLERATGVEARLLQQMLADRGYFLDARGGKMYSNEGDLLFETKKGVRYTLRFGELVPGEGEELTAGTTDPNKKPKDGDKPKEGEAKSGNNRYLMVTAEFVEDLIAKPAGPRLAKDQLDKRATARTDIEAIHRAVEAYRAKHENKLPESLAKLTEKPAEGDAPLKELKKDPWGNDYLLSVQGEGYAVLSFADGNAEGGEGAAADVRSDRLPQEDELKKTADAWIEYDRKVEDGRKEAEKLGKRFGPWYYVIDQALFGKLKPKRADLVKPKAAPPAPAPDATTPHEPGK